MAVKAARERGRAERGIAQPERRAPGERSRRVREGLPLLRSREPACRRPSRLAGRRRRDGRRDRRRHRARRRLRAAVPAGGHRSDRAIAALADDRRINCHVDACMGGMMLPYLARLGEEIPPWNFAVPGVTSISVDLHKFGYTTKGASVIVHRSRELRSHQTFVTSNWLGGMYGSSGVLGTKGGGAIAAAWAVMNHLGDDGYLRLAASGATGDARARGGDRHAARARAASAARRDDRRLRRGRTWTARCLRRRR